MNNSNGLIATQSQSLAKQLRLELKQWEQSFAVAHQGRKAGREDIKKHPNIAHKYKQYDRLRCVSSKQPAAHSATPSKKRSTSNSHPLLPSHSPYKRPKHVHSIHSASTSSHDLQSPQHLSPRILHTSIGPTPQKDGQVLGLFDQLSAASNSQTPSKRKVLQSVVGNTLATPSKSPRSKGQMYTGKSHHKSPLSGTKCKLVDNPLTPPIRRTVDFSTPAPQNAISSLRFDDTPTFLKRDSQRTDVRKGNVLGDEGEVSWSPVAIRKLPKAAGRGLSAIVRGLREMEDEGLDEDLNMLREMESESASTKNRLAQLKVFANESRPDMPLVPDGGLESDEDGVQHADDRKGKDGKPLKVWKKKGQKRTTRRVLMKPNTAKWKPEPAWEVGQANRDTQDGGAEIQKMSVDQSKSCDCESDDYEDVEGSQTATALENSRGHALDNNLEKERRLVKKAKKKISATAHANFRALHIKNKQSKLKKGGRFGRER